MVVINVPYFSIILRILSIQKNQIDVSLISNKGFLLSSYGYFHATKTQTDIFVIFVFLYGCTFDRDNLRNAWAVSQNYFANKKLHYLRALQAILYFDKNKFLTQNLNTRTKPEAGQLVQNKNQ